MVEVKESLKKVWRTPPAIVVIIAIAAIVIGMNISVQTESPQEVSDAPLTLLYFHKPTCPSCEKMEPVIDGLEERWAGFAKVERWDVSMPISQMKAQEYNIRGVPTLILVDSADQVLGRWVGYQSPDEIDQLLGWLKFTYKSGDKNGMD